MQHAHQNEDLAEMVIELKRQFRLLVNDVQRSLEKEDIERLKNHTRLLLQENLGTIVVYRIAARPTIDPIQNITDLFKFLLERNFISYLNYEVLCDYADMVPDDEDIKRKVKKYIEKYNTFVEKPAFAELIEVFTNYPDLCPSEIIGLPRIVVTIARDARKKSLESLKNSWKSYVKSKREMIQDISMSPLGLTYAMFPQDLKVVENKIKSPEVVKHFEEEGVSVKFSEATQNTEVYITYIIALTKIINC